MNPTLAILLASAGAPTAHDAGPVPEDPTIEASFYAAGVADPLAVEAELRALGVDPGRAHLISVGPRETGTDGVTCASLARSGDRAATGRACAPLVARWGGAMRPFLARRGYEGNARAMVLVEDDRDVGTLAILTPGDSVEVREIRRNGLLLVASVRLAHAGRALELRRGRRYASVCVDDARSGARCARVALTGS